MGEGCPCRSEDCLGVSVVPGSVPGIVLKLIHKCTYNYLRYVTNVNRGLSYLG